MALNCSYRQHLAFAVLRITNDTIHGHVLTRALGKVWNCAISQLNLWLGFDGVGKATQTRAAHNGYLWVLKCLGQLGAHVLGRLGSAGIGIWCSDGI